MLTFAADSLKGTARCVRILLFEPLQFDPLAGINAMEEVLEEWSHYPNGLDD